MLSAADDQPRVRYLAPEEVPSYGLRMYMGVSESDQSTAVPRGVSVAAVTVSDATAQRIEPDESRWLNVRDAAPQLSDLDAGACAEALAMVNWHGTHTHCPRCGAATEEATSGWVRRCPAENLEIFPRTDPAIIVGIVDDNDRILLGSNAMWGSNRFSLLAGFVEPGESLEAAVVREVFEESGMKVQDPAYLGSQPWPFPASVMLGFVARLAPGQDTVALRPDGEEIVELRWFSRDELLAERNNITLPGHVSIARAILEHWYGGPVPEPTDPRVRW